MESNTVAVIIPTYNRADLLRESLISISRQTRPADQVIVVDDGSTDNTAAVVQDVFREFFPGAAWPFVRYIRRETNAGKSFAVNEGIAAAEMDLIWIFDDDDIADPRRLEAVVPYFEEDPDLDVVHTDAEFRDQIDVDPDGKVSPSGWKDRSFWYAVDVPDRDRFRWFLTGNRWFGISVIWRRSILSRLSDLETAFGPGPGYFWKRTWETEEGKIHAYENAWPFDPYLGRAQDYDFFMRLIWAGARSKAVNTTTVYARTHEGARGPGHALKDGDAVEQATADAEKWIFRKIYDRVPLEAIWPEEEGLAVAYVERAYALLLRGMWEKVAADLASVGQDVSGLRDVHIEALARMIDATFVPPDEFPADIRPHVLKARRQAIRIRDDWKRATGIETAVRPLISTITKG